MFTKRPVWCLWILGIGCTCLHAQQTNAQQLPNVVNSPYRLANPYNYAPVQVPSPYWGYSYSYSYFSYGDYLHGAADVIRSQGQFMINKQQANLLREEYQQQKLVTRRKEYEQWRWERDFKNQAYEQERKRIREAEIERDRNDPPQTQILAGASLNLLLAELKKAPNLSPGRSAPVNSDWLPHIHVTYASSGTGGNVGLLKGEQIHWPLLLRQEEFRPQRETIEKLLGQAKEEALAGKAGADTLIEARRQVKQLEQRVVEELRASRNDLWTPGDFVDAKRSLREFSSALQMLQRPDAAYYLKPLQGRTVAELVQFMSDKGLSFAPATMGGERAYTALRQALATELTNVRNGR
jgi:hypothetical protein